MGLLSTRYMENGVEKTYDHVAFVGKLRESHFSEFKSLVRKAMGTRTQVQFASDLGVSKYYLNRVMKDGNDTLPSNKVMENIARLSQDPSVTVKELLIYSGRVPYSEKLDDELKNWTTPSIMCDDNAVNHIYIFKKDLIEMLIRERGKKTELSPLDYTRSIMGSFNEELIYTGFDFECFACESPYDDLDDWSIDLSYNNDRDDATDMVTGYVTAAVRKRFDPDEWVRTKVSFSIFFSKDSSDGTLNVIDTDWDIPGWAIEEPEFDNLHVEGGKTLKEFLDEESTISYVVEELDSDE